LIDQGNQGTWFLNGKTPFDAGYRPINGQGSRHPEIPKANEIPEPSAPTSSPPSTTTSPATATFPPITPSKVDGTIDCGDDSTTDGSGPGARMGDCFWTQGR
jgi:hypothetical protein